MLKLENTTIDNHVHTHIEGGGGSATTIERALLLLRTTFIQIKGGADAIATTQRHIHRHKIEHEKREWGAFLLLKQGKGEELN
jgi:hypothetical protein